MRTKTELRSRHLPTVVEQASSLPVAAEKCGSFFSRCSQKHGRLEACPTSQRRSRFRVQAKIILVCLTLTTLLTGCQTRSISNSGYSGGYYCEGGDPFYRGELNEFDLLGIVPKESIMDEQIGKALDASARVTLRKGSSVLLIQSGAMQPDKPMLDAMEKHFAVVPFTGQPGATNAAGYARALRLAAAQAGCETMICYWGTLESASKGNEAKTVS